MITILIADDNAHKTARIVEVLSNLLPPEEMSIREVACLNDAGQILEKQDVDLLILDLNIPRRSGDSPLPGNGSQFLDQLYTGRRMKRPRFIVGITAFDDLMSHGAAFAERMWLLLRYEESSSSWAKQLTTLILHIADLNVRAAANGYRTDLAIVTALETVELESVRALPAKWEQVQMPGDDTIYHKGTFERDGQSLSVVAAAALEMGMPASTALSMKIIEQFRPRYLAMVGIAAGVKGNFGDILVADQAWDYGSGKSRAGASAKDRLAPDPRPIPLHPLLKAQLSLFQGETEVLESIRRGWAGGEVANRIEVRIGPVASGSSVVEDRSIVESIQEHARKLIGVEMETYGVFLAARMCTAPRPSAMSFKSICDFADPEKADRHQRYAAYTSARFLYEFSLRMLAGVQLPITS